MNHDKHRRLLYLWSNVVFLVSVIAAVGSMIMVGVILGIVAGWLGVI